MFDSKNTVFDRNTIDLHIDRINEIAEKIEEFKSKKTPYTIKTLLDLQDEAEFLKQGLLIVYLTQHSVGQHLF